MGLGQLSKILFSVFLVALISAPLSSDASAATLREAIQTRIDTGAGGGLGDDDDERMLRVHDFYRERNYEPIWTADGGANNKARMLTKLLNAASDEALHPNTYRADVLNDMISASDGAPQGVSTRTASAFSRPSISYRPEPPITPITHFDIVFLQMRKPRPWSNPERGRQFTRLCCGLVGHVAPDALVREPQQQRQQDQVNHDWKGQ